MKYKILNDGCKRSVKNCSPIISLKISSNFYRPTTSVFNILEVQSCTNLIGSCIMHKPLRRSFILIRQQIFVLNISKCTIYILYVGYPWLNTSIMYSICILSIGTYYLGILRYSNRLILVLRNHKNIKICRKILKNKTTFFKIKC